MNENEPEADVQSDVTPAAEDGLTIRIEGDALVLPSGCTLPQICIKTNQPVSERDMILANLSWRPNSLAFWALLGSPWLILAYFAGGELCLITYGLNQRMRYRNIVITLAKILGCIGFLAAAIFLAGTGSRNWIIEPLMYLCFILFLLSVVVLFVSKKPLRVVKHRNGMFWVEGFTKQYLDDLQL